MTSLSTRTVAIDVLGRIITMTAPAKYIIPKSIERGGLASHEPETLATALALCELRPGAFLDIGANVGIFSIVVATILARQCHAFEPTPEMADVIRAIAQAHELPIKVHQVAVSHSSGTTTLYLSAKSDSSNSLNRRFRRHLGTLKVAVDKLDNLELDSATVIKIDTESTEPDVLAGAGQMIRNNRPTIICEALPGRTETGLNKFLEEHCYIPYHIRPELLWPEQTHVASDGSKHYNWLFSPDRPTPELWQRIAYWRKRILAGKEVGR
jgi:FkbM family methyltransferase